MLRQRKQGGIFCPMKMSGCAMFLCVTCLCAPLLEVVGSIQELIDQLDEAGEREQVWDDRLRAFIIGFPCCRNVDEGGIFSGGFGGQAIGR